MSEKQRIKEVVRPVSKLVEDDEYKVMLSELKTKAKIDTQGEEIYHLLNENFGGAF